MSGCPLSGFMVENGRRLGHPLSGFKGVGRRAADRSVYCQASGAAAGRTGGRGGLTVVYAVYVVCGSIRVQLETIF